MLGTKQIRTATCHSIANGLVKHFQSQIKVALKCQSIPERWTNSIQNMLLGLCTALKDDLHYSSDELVYGSTLSLPAEFFHSSDSNTLEQVTYITRLKETMNQVQATPAHHCMRQKPFMSFTAPTSLYNKHCNSLTTVLTKSSEMETKPSLLT